jgi:fused signal recognition particle receptor
MSDIIDRWRKGLSRTSKSTFGRIANLLGATEITSDTWDALEALLIQADLGIETTEGILAALREEVQRSGLTKAEELKSALRQELRTRLDKPPPWEIITRPSIILLVGVNGSGKTTSAAKLAYRLRREGKQALLVAADTFRAAAIEQLQAWAERVDVPVLAGQPGGDPGAVTYDAIQSAKARHIDAVLIDTAGRLHTRFNLMEELKKVYRVAGKALPGAPHAVWLVMDATTGQNGLLQARAFSEAVKVTGIILAKLDSSARGGIAFAIQQQLGLPILFAGLGETPDDLQPFDPEAFVEGILASFN